MSTSPKKNESMNGPQKVQDKLEKMRIAQKEFSGFSQEQVDKIFYQAAMEANKARIPLAKQAVAETGMGVVEDKVIKNHYASEYMYNAFKKVKTCGVIERDNSLGIEKIAEPLGVIAAVIPTTNPTSTAIFKCLIALKTRNGIIISPHPRAKQCTCDAAKLVYNAAIAAGAPEGIIQWIEEPSLDATSFIMKECDVILATGGPAMVKAAYSSGKPALGVGPGNTPAIFDESCDILVAVNSVVHSKTFDNGMICASEQSVVVHEKIYDKVRKEFIKRGCYMLSAAEIDKLREVILVNGTINAKIVGQPAHVIAELAGFSVPKETKILIGEVTSVEPEEAFAHEKLSPVLAMYSARTFEDAVEKADRLVHDGGFGHTSCLYVNETLEKDKVALFTSRMKTGRILINTPSSQGAIGDLYNFGLAPSLTLGCGSWGGNSVSENVGVKHLINIKTVAERRENMLWFRAPQKVYFKKGCLPVALKELNTYYNKKKAFIVTDKFLYESGNTKKIESLLDKMGITHTCYSDVRPDPTLGNAKRGAEAMREFQPDVIIALGGGSAMDAGKIMWVLYEHPEADFLDMAMRFMDIRKRVYDFPKMGNKAYFIAIPTSSGTGSEVTPFAVITDETTGNKYPLADYELLPNMAVIDTDFMMSQPPGLTAASGLDALTHALEAHASILATDFTDGLALQAMRNIFKYLPEAYVKGVEAPVAREKMAHASTMAGMAFANGFLGICHSMAHKLGAFHHLPHGIANALLITHVMRYNSTEVPPKMGTFSQYPYPKALERYCECAKYCGIVGKDNKEIFEKFINKIEGLKEECGVKKTIKDYGVEEKDFLETLDDMVEKAFDDQCTGGNPRYPLMSEMKEMFLAAYYGEKTE